MPDLDLYRQLLDRYDALIRTEPWWDGRRDALVRQMDPVWDRMSRQERQAALAHATLLYERGLKEGEYARP